MTDLSTQDLMKAFYRLRETEPRLPKVEALRQAQLSMLNGKSQHPYHWAPFLLLCKITKGAETTPLPRVIFHDFRGKPGFMTTPM